MNAYLTAEKGEGESGEGGKGNGEGRGWGVLKGGGEGRLIYQKSLIIPL